ncbi:MAG: hypothetical protein J0G98_07950 [Terrimonas ferruginea]|uniref:hypothetical protein n=1 Tax=Terrimonas ferruginea TaxID=249 RepID=UPI001ACA145B|nr:hypothetical protein [Terrimonas ferruginea]MBN8782980.1 hypothetical protein [Terrimonas ferruginea]
MRKVFFYFVETVFWIQLFLAPVGIGMLVALLIYLNNERLSWLSIIVMAISVIIGITYAERVRRRRGTSRYAAKRLATPDIWRDECPEEQSTK